MASTVGPVPISETGANACKLRKKPSEYFRSNFYACFWFERRNLVHDIRQLGVENCLFETDYPHPTSLYPGVQDKLVSVLKDHDHATRKLVLQDNAAKLYNLPI